MKIMAPAFIALLATWCTLAPAQTRIITPENLTEARLVQALTPAHSGPVTRSLKVSQNGASIVPKRRPSASLLITFETNSATLTESAKQQLATVAQALQNERLAPYQFDVEGHADPRGSAQANMQLSKERALSVRQFLVSDYRIAQTRLHAVAKGALEPLNTQFIAAPENRRVTIVTQPGQSSN